MRATRFSASCVDDFVARRPAGRDAEPVRQLQSLRPVRGSRSTTHGGTGSMTSATGHHARVASDDGEPHLLRGADAHKDQTYFLYGLQRDVLESSPASRRRTPEDPRVLARARCGSHGSRSP